MENNMDRYLGQTLDNRYEIQEIIGSGGMAVVFKARCNRLNRLVAVKILKDEFANDNEFKEHFKAESQAVAMLSHPNIVAVYDFSKESDTQYIVMELLEGITLKQYMQKKQDALSWKEALHFSTQVAMALSHAHSKGIVHRDIKPQNIMVVKDGSIKVADFGIAHLQNETCADSGETIGSVHYISPEQIHGDPVDARSDIYSLGIVMYEMLTGRLPYVGDTVEAVAMQHLNSILTLPGEINPDIPQRLEEITLKAMCASIDERYQSADELLEDLEAFRREQTGQSTEALSAEQVVEYTSNGEPLIRPFRRTGEMTKENYARRKFRSRKVSTLSGFGLIAIFLIAVGVFLWNFWLEDMFVDSQRIEIQNFIGENSEDIINSAAYKNIYNFYVVYAIDPNYAEGQIIAQNPEPGRSIMLTSSGIDIELTVSTGILMTKIPNVVNMEYREATIALEKLGFVVKTELVASETITEDYVVASKPAADEELPAGSTVYLSISGGPELIEVTMPNLIGKSQSVAIAAIEEAGLTLGSVSEVESDYTKGTIFWQNIDAGDKITKGTVVYLKVSTGPEETETPSPSEEPTTEPPTEVTPPPAAETVAPPETEGGTA